MHTDLRPKRAAVSFAAAPCRLFTVLALLLCFSPLDSSALPINRDYVAPEHAKGGYISPVQGLEATRDKSKTESTVDYRAISGSTYRLKEHRGLHVNVLVPETFADGPFFTDEHLEELVDQLDILYTLYRDILQVEPAGSGLVPVAFVPETCGAGCGLLGNRGFEIRSDKSNYESIIAELNAGRLSRLLLHEMAHNFDVYADYLHYLPDHAHAWTDMFEYFAPYRYSKITGKGMSPDDLYRYQIDAAWRTFVTEPSADWEACIKYDDCAGLGLTANMLWAMLYHRVEDVHGIQAILESFEYLKSYADRFPPPGSDEAREGLRVLSLAMGIGSDISCYLDALDWPVENSFAQQMLEQLGVNEQLCSDQDQDGFTRINGDCDDSNPAININQPEIDANQSDDDCDGLVDETVIIESALGDAADNLPGTIDLTLPFEIRGSTADVNDHDGFRFDLPASSRAVVTLCAEEGFEGWVVARQPNGEFLAETYWFGYQSKPGCTTNTFDFGHHGTGNLLVMANQSAGEYRLVVNGARDLPPDHSAMIEVLPNPSGGMTLRFADQDGLFASMGTDQLDVRISGIEGHLSAPMAAVSEVELSAVTTPGLVAGQTYQARVRPMRDGLPLAAYSAGHLFRYESTPGSLPEVDHRFSGAWFDPDHDGEGYLIEILENQRAVVYWFTYRADGSQRWMVGTGAIEANRITVPRLMSTRGGRFGMDFNPDDVVMEKTGSMTLSFLDCSTALVNYSVKNNGGQQDTIRLTEISGHGCNDITPGLNEDISGSWYDPSHNGEGFIVEQVSDTRAVVFWFTYNGEGEQSWMFNTGTIENGSIHVPRLLRPMGGGFGREYEPANVTRRTWGELTLDLSCSGGTARYATDADGFSDGSQSLVRLTTLANSNCLD